MKVKFVKGGYARVDDLTFHPLNEEIYPRDNHQEDIELLKEKMQEWFDDYGYGNHTPVIVCPKTGVIYSGNFRVLVAKLLGFEFVLAVECKERIYKKNTNKYDELQFLMSYNQDGKRNESNPRTALRLWNAKNDAYTDAFGKEHSAKDRNQFAREVGIDKDVFKKIVEIGAVRPDLIEQIISGDISVRKAYTLIKAPKPKEIADPNRHTFYGDLIKYPSIVDHTIERSISITRAHIAVGGNVIDDPVAGWEPQFKTTIWSNAIMSALTEAFNLTGDKKLQCAAAGAVSNKTYADVLFQYLTDLANKKLNGNKRYFDTQIEIKAAEFNGNAGDTKIYSGIGSINLPSQEFVVACHTGNFSKFLIMMVTIEGKDWSTTTKGATLSLSQLYKLNPTYLLGEMFEGKRKVEIQWGDA